ncbi:MAG TPA: NTP transferase domain-containing protein, partial [Candidatus Krumholzibacteria bacterium]|nr:NTP transferase domain-containing protein [Candidatus Krumholzibacteria bacterium]
MSRQSSSIEKGQVVAVIPARYGSTRFPGKPLALLRGQPLIAYVVRAAKEARRVGEVLVATDDERIARAAREAGASVRLTRGDHATGSDRIGEVVQQREEELVLNVQGDEPLVRPSAIDRLVELLEEHPQAAVSTLASPLSLLDEAYR